MRLRFVLTIAVFDLVPYVVDCVESRPDDF